MALPLTLAHPLDRPSPARAHSKSRASPFSAPPRPPSSPSGGSCSCRTGQPCAASSRSAAAVAPIRRRRHTPARSRQQRGRATMRWGPCLARRQSRTARRARGRRWQPSSLSVGWDSGPKLRCGGLRCAGGCVQSGAQGTAPWLTLIFPRTAPDVPVRGAAWPVAAARCRVRGVHLDRSHVDCAHLRRRACALPSILHPHALPPLTLAAYAPRNGP